MEKQETGLEVHLVRRVDHGKPGVDKRFYATVVKTEIHNNNWYLQVYEMAPFSSLCSLLMENYYILAVSWEPGDGIGRVEELYSISKEDQNEAREAIDLILSDAAETAGTEEEKEQGTNVIGPKRTEIVIRKVGHALEEQNVVVTSLIPPNGSFNYFSVGGRSWKNDRLSRSVQFYNSNTYWLTKITCFAGGLSGSLTETFISSESDQKKAWEKLAREFSHFKPAELFVVREWTSPTGSPRVVYNDEEAWGEDVHYYNRLPSVYQPRPKPVAMLRVSGDEIGVSICQEQQGRKQTSSRPRSLSELVDLEKNLAVKKTEEEKKTQEASSESAPPVESPCDCGYPACVECYQEYFTRYQHLDGEIMGYSTGDKIH